MDLSPQNFAKLFDDAVGFHLEPPFDPYANSLNYLLASYVLPYVGLVGYVGAIPGLTHNTTRRVSTSLINFFPLVINDFVKENSTTTYINIDNTITKYLFPCS